jgi:hypothetical protein
MAMPKQKRTLLLLLGHAENELNALTKMIRFAANGAPSNEIELHAEASQISTLMRLLIGKLNESWEMFRTRFLSNGKVAKQYLLMLEESTLAALERLKGTFGKSDLLSNIRNKYAFHFPPDDAIEASLRNLPDADKWAFFPSDINANSYYHLSESAVSYAMIRSAGLTDSTAAIDMVYDRVVKVSADMRAPCWAIVSRQWSMTVSPTARTWCLQWRSPRLGKCQT